MGPTSMAGQTDRATESTPDMPSGRFAPSPTGRLHLGNLRTALLAWLFARSDGSPFWIRFEDLDTASVRPEHYQSQLEDLRLLGLDWDDDVIRQRDRRDLYESALSTLYQAGLTYPCYCSRREIREATQAPNGPWSHGHYPGTCSQLTAEQRIRHESAGRTPSLRLRGSPQPIEFVDLLCGPTRGLVDDAVVQRFDGTPAYNLAVVVDDVAQEIELVVRADDLLDSTPRQLHIADVLGLPPPRYAHVPLVLAPSGDRLAKRDGAVTLADRMALGEDPVQVLSFLATTLGLAEAGERVSPGILIDRFPSATLPTEPLVLEPDRLDLG
jgi:glutamyl-tRNA synthetase